MFVHKSWKNFIPFFGFSSFVITQKKRENNKKYICFEVNWEEMNNLNGQSPKIGDPFWALSALLRFSVNFKVQSLQNRRGRKRGEREEGGSRNRCFLKPEPFLRLPGVFCQVLFTGKIHSVCAGASLNVRCLQKFARAILTLSLSLSLSCSFFNPNK